MADEFVNDDIDDLDWDSVLEDLDEDEFEELEDYVLEDEDIDDGMGDTPCDCGNDCTCVQTHVTGPGPNTNKSQVRNQPIGL